MLAYSTAKEAYFEQWKPVRTLTSTLSQVATIN